MKTTTIQLNSAWAKTLRTEQPARYARLIGSLRIYAATPVKHRPTYAKYAALVSRWFSVPLSGKALEHICARHFTDAPHPSRLMGEVVTDLLRIVA